MLSFDGRYVWSFSPVRDGRPQPRRHARRLAAGAAPVPAAAAPGSRVADVAGTRVLLDAEVVLGDGPDRIAVVDPQGLPLAVDKVGHLCRAFSATDEAIRDEILAGTRRALDDLREACGVEAYLNYGALLGAVRDGAMIAHDSDTDVCYLSRTASPADLIVESYRIERGLRALGWNVLRMSGGDVKLLLPLSDGRQCHVDVFVAFRVGETFYQLGNRSGPPAGVRDPAALDDHAARPRVPRAGRPGGDAGVRLRSRLAGARPVVPVRRPGRRHPAPRRLAARVPHRHGAVDRVLPRSGRGPGPARRARLRPLGPAASCPRASGVADLGCGTGRDAIYFARRGRPVLAFEFSRAARGVVRRRVARRGLPVEVRTADAQRAAHRPRRRRRAGP